MGKKCKWIEDSETKSLRKIVKEAESCNLEDQMTQDRQAS